MTEPARISCVMPVHNGAEYIGEAVESLFAQALPPCELILVDDGSTDDSAAVAVSVAGSRVKVVRQEQSGPEAARNRGLREASGRYIGFLDADDVAPPEALRSLHEALTEHPEWFGVFGTWENFWVDAEREKKDLKAIPTLGKRQTSSFLAAGLYRRSLFKRMPPLPEDNTAYGTSLWLTDLQRSDFACGHIEELTLMRRIHSDNMSRARSADKLFELVLEVRKRTAE